MTRINLTPEQAHGLLDAAGDCTPFTRRMAHGAVDTFRDYLGFADATGSRLYVGITSYALYPTKARRYLTEQGLMPKEDAR